MTLTWLLWVTEGISAAAILAAWRCRGRVGIALVLLAVVAILILHGYVYWDHTADDAFISFRYARNFAHGNGLVWNPGERVEGYSNFLWVLLLAGTEFLKLGIVEPARWLGFAATLGTIVVVFALARELTDDAREAELTFAVAALLLVSTAPLALWTFAGLEEPLFGFCAALALCVHILEERGAARYPLSAGVAFAAALTRPDGLLVGGLILALKAAPLLVLGDRVARAKRLLVWVAALGVPYAAYIGWRFSYYGYPLPNTYYQKLDGAGPFEWQRYRDGYDYVRTFWQQYGLLLLFPIPFLALLRRTSRRAATPMLAFITAWTGYVIYVGGDFFYFFRFLVPVLPLCYLLSTHTVISGINRLLMPNVRRQASAFFSVVLLATIGWLIHVPQTDVNVILFWEAVATQNQQVANWMRTQDHQTVIAVYAAGQLPYWSQLPAIDMLGLTNAHIAHRAPYPGLILPGHRKGDARYVLDQRPDIIVTWGTFWPVPASELTWRTLPGSYLPAYNDLFAQPDLWKLYEPAWVRLPGGVFNFLVLKGSTRVQAEKSPAISDGEMVQLRARDLPGSCDNAILPRPPFTGDDGYFYLARWDIVPGAPRRAVTEYRSDVAASSDSVAHFYQQFLTRLRWTLTGTEHGALASHPGVGFTTTSFRFGTDTKGRTALVSIADDGKTLITSADFIAPDEAPKKLYPCIAQ